MGRSSPIVGDHQVPYLPWHIAQLAPAALRSFLMSVTATPPWINAVNRALASAAAGDADLLAISYWSAIAFVFTTCAH
jgi:hypothetical protein